MGRLRYTGFLSLADKADVRCKFSCMTSYQVTGKCLKRWCVLERFFLIIHSRTHSPRHWTLNLSCDREDFSVHFLFLKKWNFTACLQVRTNILFRLRLWWVTRRLNKLGEGKPEDPNGEGQLRRRDMPPKMTELVMHRFVIQGFLNWFFIAILCTYIFHHCDGIKRNPEWEKFALPPVASRSANLIHILVTFNAVTRYIIKVDHIFIVQFPIF